MAYRPSKFLQKEVYTIHRYHVMKQDEFLPYILPYISLHFVLVGSH